MNYLVVGAGNASRPVARLLNYLGHKVVITDLKDISEFKIEFQRSLIEMEKEKEGYSRAVKSILLECEKNSKLNKGVKGV